jgi:hypothetical protein
VTARKKDNSVFQADILLRGIKYDHQLEFIAVILPQKELAAPCDGPIQPQIIRAWDKVMAINEQARKLSVN